jgi:NADPH2:quinone reductase
MPYYRAMKAVNIIDNRVKIVDVDEPRPGPGELLVAVRAAGLNGADLAVLRLPSAGQPAAARRIPGLEVAGEVVEVGKTVTRFAPGDAVMGLVPGGGHAEFVAIPGRLAMRMPATLSWQQAGGFTEVFTTAHDALITLCGLAPGERLLVHGAAGGVGIAAVQLGVLAGAKVTATVRSQAHHAAVAGFGAVVVSPDDFRSHGPFDVVLELVGAPNMPANIECLATGGRIALIGMSAGHTVELDLRALMGKRGRLLGSVLLTRSDEEKGAALRAVERDVLPLVESRRATVPIQHTFALNAAADAYDAFAHGGKFGKIVLDVESAAR